MKGSRVSTTNCTQRSLSVYATLWLQKWVRNFGTTKQQKGAVKRALWSGLNYSICWHKPFPRKPPIWTDTHRYNTVYVNTRGSSNWGIPKTLSFTPKRVYSWMIWGYPILGNPKIYSTYGLMVVVVVVVVVVVPSSRFL